MVPHFSASELIKKCNQRQTSRTSCLLSLGPFYAVEPKRRVQSINSVEQTSGQKRTITSPTVAYTFVFLKKANIFPFLFNFINFQKLKASSTKIASPAHFLLLNTFFYLPSWNLMLREKSRNLICLKKKFQRAKIIISPPHGFQIREGLQVPPDRR